MPHRLASKGSWCVAVVACVASAPMSTHAQAPALPGPQAELLRGAQLWAAKNRPDLARQLLEKLLLTDRYSAMGLASLGELSLRENNTKEAQRILATLRTQHPQSPLTQELERLVQVYGPEREKLAQMRLMARAGRMDEAAQLARMLFPAGPPSIGSLALEYFQILGAAKGQGSSAQHQLQRLYRQTGESRYQLAWLDMQLAQGARAHSLLPAIEALAGQADVDRLALQALWRRALAQQGDNAATARSAQRFLRLFPDDQAMVERLATLQQTQERAQQRAQNPAQNPVPDPTQVARNAALQALEQGNNTLAEEKLQQVLALRPRDAQSIGNLGLVRLRQGQHVQAQELLGQAYALSGQEQWAQLQSTARFWGLLRQAELALEHNEIATAENLARKALALQPANPEAINTLAGIRALQNALPEAQTLYEQALQHDADNSDALRGLARLYARQGQPDQGLALLEKAVTSHASLAGKLAGLRADLLQEQAKALEQAQRPGAALRALEAAVALESDNPWVRHSLAQLYVRLRLPQEALHTMDEGVALAPGAAAMRYARALIRSALDDETGALADMAHIAPADRTEGMQELVQRASVNQLIAQATSSTTPASDTDAHSLLERAEALAKNDTDLLYAVANAWFRRGQPQQGLAVFDRLQARSSPLPAPVQLDHTALLHRAQNDAAVAQRLPLLLAHGPWSSAQEAQLLALYGNHQERQIQGQHAAGKSAQALQLAQAPLPDLRTRSPAPPTQQQRRRVQAQLQAAAGEYADASTVLQALVAELPDDAALRMALGDALSRQGRSKEALVQARWLAQHLPRTDTNQQLALLRLWQRAGDLAEARALSLQLLQSAPADTDVLLHAARLERAEGQYAQAIGLFQRAWARQAHSTGKALAHTASPPIPADTAATAQSKPLALAYSLQWPPRASPPAAITPDTSGLPDELPGLPLALTYTLKTSPAIHATAYTGDEALDKIATEVRTIEARRQVWIEGGQQALEKNATEGISSLHGWERPMVAWMPRGYDGHYVLHVDQVQLDAGALPLQRDSARNYGQVAAWPEGDYRLGGTRQRSTGTNVGFGFVGDNLEWDIGATGIGFPVTNLVGGVSLSDSSDGLNYRFGVSRRPLTGNLMTYAGAYDPITGAVWGGVVATGLSTRVSTDIGPYSTSLSASYGLLTGKNVRRNTRLQLRWAADRDVWQSSHSTVNFSLAVSAWRYGHDLSEFSWGHGGYYSPRNYLSLALPLEWSGRKGALTWLVRGDVSASRSSSKDSNYFPTNPALQAQASDLGGQPVYLGGRSTGLGRSFRAAIEYDLSQQLTLGAQLDLDRSAYYAPTSLLFYARYRFHPLLVPPENRPRPVQTYSSF